MRKALLITAILALVTPVEAAKGPAGYQIMCLGNPGVCVGDDRPIRLEDVLPALNIVNSRVNRTMRERADKGLDVWSIGGAAGDCEDFALTKRAALVKAGVPVTSMMIAVVTLPSGEGHAVLVVSTDKGKLVLDNLRDDIVPLGRTGYRVRMLLP